ncbi:MAG: DivIVA domain-containing protein [Clostridiales bacterium]|nr:DivIVA domain-containing protein [Clostridiales bacterium]
MQISDFKKGLFGYKKENVYHYISELNEDCSERIAKVQGEYSKRIKELEERNAALEEKLALAESRMASFQKDYCAIADSIVDAQHYAHEMKSTTQVMEEKNRSALADSFEKGRKTVEDYLLRINRCRLHLKAQLESIDSSLAAVETEASELAGEANAFSGISGEESAKKDASDNSLISLKADESLTVLQPKEESEQGFFAKRSKLLIKQARVERNKA